MSEGETDLWQELSRLADAFAALGRQMLHASRLLHAPGVPPSESLAGDAAALRAGFASVRAAIRVQAAAVSLPAGDDAELDTLKSLAALLDAIDEVEARREEWERRIIPALGLLDRIALLSHTVDPAFEALVSCQAQARALRDAIADAEPDEREAEVDALAELDHPFAYLLTMVDGAERVNDDLWGSLFEAVTAAFGKSLAAAVTRSRIVFAAEGLAAEPVFEPDAGAAEVVFAPEPPGVGRLPLAAVREEVETVDEPGWSSVPSLTVEWAEEPPTRQYANLSGSAPLSTLELSDDLLTSVVAGSIPFLPKSLATLLGARKLGRGGRHKSAPKIESLETVRLLSCPTISGFVFLDANNNGLFEASESPIAGNGVKLLNASGTVVGAATTDAQGAYAFLSDSTIDLTTRTQTQTATVPTRPTNFSSNVTLPQFDPALGTLTQVDVHVDGTLSSRIRSENTSASAPATLSATVSGDIALTSSALGLSVSVPVSSPPDTFDASPFSGGPIDYNGPSGHDFGVQSASFHQSRTMTTNLSPFVGVGSLSATFAANATSGATGDGNLSTEADSTASAVVSVTYYYTPMNCLAPGQYTIVQATEPPGTLNGLDSRDGVVLPPNTTGGPDAIPITLGTENAVNNDFGELSPDSLSGFVYEDTNNNGTKQPGEPPISGVPVELTGTNDLGAIAPQFAATDANGEYSFNLLRPGAYSVTETSQPAGYFDGQDTRGNVVPLLGGNKTDVIPDILLALGQAAPNNNFGELLPGGLSGFVYNDRNNNGTKQANEPGITGVPVRLTGVNDLGPIAARNARTDANGAYNFGNLRPGTYTVTETQQPKNFADGLDTRGNVAPIPGSNKTDFIASIPVSASLTAPNNNFGEITVPAPGGQTGGGTPPAPVPPPVPPPVPCPLPPATVETVKRLGVHHHRTQFVLTFNEALDPTSAANLANYHLSVAFRNGRIARREIPLKSVVYNPILNTVTLDPAHQLNIHYHYQLTVSGVQDACGRPIDGDRDGTAGGNFVTVVTKQNYSRSVPAGPVHAAHTGSSWKNRFPRLAAERKSNV